MRRSPAIAPHCQETDTWPSMEDSMIDEFYDGV